MTKNAYYQRLCAYVLAAMLTQYIGDAQSLRNADFVEASIIVAKVLLSGVIVWRAFIDQSWRFLDGKNELAKKNDKNLIE